MPKQKQPITASGLEKSLLQDYTKTSPLILIRLKAQAILLAVHDVNPDSIALAMGKKPSTVERWLRDWCARRMASIFTGHKDNDNAGKLTDDQLEEIRQALQSPPSDFGLPKAFWDVPQMKQYIEAAFGVVYESDTSYHFLLKFSNLSFKYPDVFDRRRNDAGITERMAAIRVEIAPLLQDDTWEVFAVDEVKLQQEAIIRQAWLQRGERTIVDVNRDKESQSYIGLLNQKSFACELYEMAWQKTSEVLKALGCFLERHPDKKICIVWDNASFHKSKALRAELHTGGLLERVHLVAMPPYAPDHNPIEHVWNTAKQAVANIQRDTFTETKRAFREFVEGRSFSYGFSVLG